MTSQLTYRNAQTLSWADDTIVVQLPSTVVSGYAAFSDLEFVNDYNAWVEGRNSRINVAMRANGCPGHWTVEVPLALNPPADAAAAYRAGAPVLMAQLSASAGPTRMFDSQTLYLHPGDAFQADAVASLRRAGTPGRPAARSCRRPCPACSPSHPSPYGSRWSAR